MNYIYIQFMALLATVPREVWLVTGFLLEAVKWFFILWVFFLAVMHLQDAQKTGVLATLHRNVQIAAQIVLYTGVTINLLVRVLFSWLLFWEVPPPFNPRRWGEWAVSAQVKRLCNEGTGFRQQRAFWWRDNVLRPFDQWGGHN